MCWIYNPRSKKARLRYDSAHSRLIKNGIVFPGLGVELAKTFEHQVLRDFKDQVERFCNAGYPVAFISSVC
ncbi:hypothetical protein HPB50_012030 [Hyalomma asiaticum]|uniref:Uncharacterized protein n=1 Tax=Hyalomma asiaticum TaxID=266040 RepID=A0ACB7T4E1_HYAAI|nr:hypothetical protein HPB50_012030 [Hyalomma asiaticum]